MKRLLPLLLPIFLLIACASEDTAGPQGMTEEQYSMTPGRRTIIAYISGDNNLSPSLSSDISEMTEGSAQMPDDCRLLVFADLNNQPPYIAHILGGKMTKVKEYPRDFYSTSPDSMLSVYQWIIDHYPSTEYATIIEGHGSGPIIEKDTVATNLLTLHAYGTDATGEDPATSTPKWMNLPSMSAVFGNLKDHNGNKLRFTYIFFDCCCCQSVETAYELRHATRYIIAPVSETPGNGADYKTMLPALCADTESAAKNIVSTYASQSRLCISAIRTDGLEALCQATRNALLTIPRTDRPLTLERKHCIYYYRTKSTPVLHDMKHIMKLNLSPEEYTRWLPYLENVVVSRHLPPPDGTADPWVTALNINFPLFRDNLTPDNYGGISMIAPSDAYDYAGSDINTTLFRLRWSNAAGWNTLGWTE